MSYRLDYIEMLEGRYINNQLFNDLSDIAVKDAVRFLTEDLGYESKMNRPNLERIFAIMSELQFYKLALKAIINTSITESEEGTKYINARASITLKARGNEKSKRIWATHYLGFYSDFVSNNGKVDMVRIKNLGRGPVVLKLVEKLKTETLM